MSSKSDPNYRFRVVGAKKIDGLFYEEGNPKRSHAHCYVLFIFPMYGICEDTFQNYRNESDELLEAYPQPVYIEFALWLMVMLVKTLSGFELFSFIKIFRKRLAVAFDSVRKECAGKPIKAEDMIRHLVIALTEYQSR